MAAQQIGTFRIEVDGPRLRATPSGALDRLLPCRRRARLRLEGPSQLGEVTVAKRRLRGTEVKRPGTARAWRVHVQAPDGSPLCRPLGFRTQAEAEGLSELLERFRTGAA